MNIEALRSDRIYAEILAAPAEKKNDIYRYKMMAPFAKKWACYHIPLKAETPGGYDIIMASAMLGHLAPGDVTEDCRTKIERISSDALWNACRDSIARSLNAFVAGGLELPVKDYLFTILLAAPDSPYIRLSNGYCGDGGIPGYITGWLEPNDYTLSRLPVALAHETAHNVRYQFIKWTSAVSLAEMVVGEGLAENFAVSLWGEALVGPWVTKTDAATLDAVVKPKIRTGLGVRSLAEMNAYLYGDEMATLQGAEPVGLPWCAGYACGYFLIKHFLKKTGKSIIEATTLPADEILAACEDFWG